MEFLTIKKTLEPWGIFTRCICIETKVGKTRLSPDIKILQSERNSSYA